MNKKTFIIFIIIIIFVAIATTIFSRTEQKRSNQNNVFEPVVLSDAKINRYNDMLSISQVSYLIANLPNVFNNGFNIEGAINYAYAYAYAFDDNYENIVLVESNNIYLPYEYVQNIIKKIFDKNIKLDEYIVKNGYILVSDDEFAKDATTFSLKNLMYNKNNKVYKATIQENDKNIEITYKEVNNSFVILEYKENV